MKRTFILLCLIFLFSWLLFASINFSIEDIVTKNDGFVYLKLKNNSNEIYYVKNPDDIFLTLYINNIKRAEFKIKYISQNFFFPDQTLYFKTNFKAIGSFKIKVIINKYKKIKETKYTDNSIEKVINGK